MDTLSSNSKSNLIIQSKFFFTVQRVEGGKWLPPENWSNSLITKSSFNFTVEKNRRQLTALTLPTDHWSKQAHWWRCTETQFIIAKKRGRFLKSHPPQFSVTVKFKSRHPEQEAKRSLSSHFILPSWNQANHNGNHTEAEEHTD